MDRILHDVDNAHKILQLTSDTLILVDKNGTCLDIDPHSDLWFLQEDRLLGKNLFNLLPDHTFQKLLPDFRRVTQQGITVNRNYRLPLEGGETYYFKCIMQPYDGDKVLCQYRDITARSNVKLQLERTNYELKEIQKAAQIGQWKYSSREKTFYYRGYNGIVCTEEERSINFQDYYKTILSEDLPAVNTWMEANRRELLKEYIEYRILLEGQVYYMRQQCYLRNEEEDGNIVLEGYIQNITDIQRKRNDINTLTHAINNAKESVYAARRDGTLIFANRQFRLNHRIAEQADLSLIRVFDVVGDMTCIEDWEERYRSIREGQTLNFLAYQPLKHDKNTLAFEGTMYSVTTDDGEETFWSFTHDISERIRYESQIKRFNRIMDTTMENIPAGIVVKDIENDFRYIYRNRESYNRDISSENAIGMNDFDYYPPEMAQQKRKEDMEIAATGKGMHWIMEGKDKNGNLLILDKQKIMVESEDFSPIIVSIEWDITQLELMRRELIESKEKAETSDKLKSAFLANMSHEIRTPLNAIVGFSRIISESDNAEERREYYEIVDANNERLLQLINEILDLSKIESGIVEFTYGPVRLHTLCKEIHDAHVFRCPQGVELRFDSPDEALSIHSDKNRIFQVFSNLIGNAFKFTTEGSVSYGYKQEGERVVFYVKDTGLGIEPEKLGRVFQRFAKLNNFAQGTGLGLSICKTIIERLGGEIAVSSEVGTGTTFTFWLPLENVIQDTETGTNSHLPGEAVGTQPSEVLPAKEDTPRPKEETTEKEEDLRATAAGTEQATILIAEDTDSNFDLLNAILGRKYRLVRAKDGMEAVTMYDEVNPDLILMDIKMPNLDGLEATRIIRQLSAEVPIIAQSAYAYEHDRNAAEEAGCNDFISKPIAQEKLKEKIKKWLK
ncbi:ATP-binding protein [Bacteroides fragilis]|jgi:signal transduction histidine kinase/CheY-like chemotaxis protein|uniref:hybrid sensor histidine kinase/response regulator n=1 Tax=Bacteroides fragilis TaxID=817 RepID=UPI0015F74C67|nr:ATP-binding protein [Bacteroides fragilis]MBA5650679.1 response regulator [Bacteroides fragilis]MCE9399529.1 response regulator [Bacteroides fragilis]MCE9468682.1 response regulator [Bacteroides fragilis]MCZ2501526.1 ATP-binding protein [Bacteroides fragilis]